MSSSEIEENVNKIKELLKSEDFGVVNTGLELARSLDEEAVYEKLLEGCGADKEGKLVNEKKEISDYLVCSLASISNGQKAKEILDNVTNLDLSSENSITNVEGLANLTNLTRLYLSDCTSLTNADVLAANN
jgi:Leucine-rich repeat (LRR) protein